MILKLKENLIFLLFPIIFGYMYFLMYAPIKVNDNQLLFITMFFTVFIIVIPLVSFIDFREKIGNKNINKNIEFKKELKSSSDYGSSIGIAKFISFIGWISVIVGVVLTISIIGISTGISIIISGFGLILGGQITRATIENTNYSKHMLETMKIKLNKQGLERHERD